MVYVLLIDVDVWPHLADIHIAVVVTIMGYRGSLHLNQSSALVYRVGWDAEDNFLLHRNADLI